MREESYERKMMSIQAYILIQTEVGKAGSVAQAVKGIAGVTIAEGVTGPYDVIMRAEAASMEELGRMVLSKVQSIPGITRTLTCPVTAL
jgi:DNA-binding Lrp family transcriptional regulator